jgi:hypothetical protein
MKYGKVLTLSILAVSIILVFECWSVVIYYGRSAVSFVPILTIIFVCIPAIIVSLDILTNGLFLRGFFGPIDYGCWGE